MPWREMPAAVPPFRATPLFSQSKLHFSPQLCDNTRTEIFRLQQFYGGTYAAGRMVDLYPAALSYGEMVF